MSATTTSSTTPHYNYKTTTATLHCLQPPVAPSVGCLSDSCITTTYFSYRFPICDTSSTALCGTMVVIRLYVYIIIHYFNLHALLIHDASHGFWNVLSKYEMGGSRLNHRRYIYIYIYTYVYTNDRGRAPCTTTVRPNYELIKKPALSANDAKAPSSVAETSSRWTSSHLQCQRSDSCKGAHETVLFFCKWLLCMISPETMGHTLKYTKLRLATRLVCWWNSLLQVQRPHEVLSLFCFLGGHLLVHLLGRVYLQIEVP